MGRNTLSVVRPVRKKRSRLWLWSVCAGLIAIVLVVVASQPQKPKEDKNRKAWDESPEGKLLQTASVNRVDPKFRPVLIYRDRGDKRPAFTGVGTQFMGSKGPVVATVEHLLVRKFANELFLLRPLSPDEHTISQGIESVVARNVDLGLRTDVDVLFVRPGVPQKLDCKSDKILSAPQQANTLKVDHVILEGDRVVRSLKSLVSGKEYPVWGAMQNPPMLIISYASQAGDSGTGFVDAYGQLYILNGGTRSDEVDPVSFLSGPFKDLESHF